MTEPTELAQALRQTTANLESHIQARAEAIAAPRIAVAEAELERECAGAAERLSDLPAEFRRQMAVVLRGRAEAAWMAGYLPAPMRHLVATGARWHHELPDEDFMARADAAAAGAGLDPADHPGQDKRQRQDRRRTEQATRA